MDHVHTIVAMYRTITGTKNIFILDLAMSMHQCESYGHKQQQLASTQLTVYVQIVQYKSMLGIGADPPCRVWLRETRGVWKLTRFLTCESLFRETTPLVVPISYWTAIHPETEQVPLYAEVWESLLDISEGQLLQSHVAKL